MGEGGPEYSALLISFGSLPEFVFLKSVNGLTQQYGGVPFWSSSNPRQRLHQVSASHLRIQYKLFYPLILRSQTLYQPSPFSSFSRDVQRISSPHHLWRMQLIYGCPCVCYYPVHQWHPSPWPSMSFGTAR